VAVRLGLARERVKWVSADTTAVAVEYSTSWDHVFAAIFILFMEGQYHPLAMVIEWCILLKLDEEEEEAHR
jgi:hypothetical protein